jgi:hypothetical protein
MSQVSTGSGGGGGASNPKLSKEDEKASGGLQENLRANELFKATAQEAMGLINSGVPTGSGAGKIYDSVNRFVGRPTEGAKGAQQLKVLAGRLTASVPRFQGPQSDKDVQLYREMAAQVGDESLTLEERQAALQTVLTLIEKYDALYKKQLDAARGPNFPSRENASRGTPSKSGSTASGW